MDDRNASKDIIYQAYITYSVVHHKTFCDGRSEMITGSCAEVLKILSPATLSRSSLVFWYNFKHKELIPSII